MDKSTDFKSRCLIKGNGKPLILVHGMGGPIVWEPITELLSNYFEVIVPVFLGYLPDDGYIYYSDDLYIEFLERLRIELKIDKLNLIGLSMGGRTVINYTLKYSYNVSKLVIIDSVGVGNMSPIFNVPIINKLVPHLICQMLSKPQNITKLGSNDFVDKKSEVYKTCTKYIKDIMDNNNIRRNFSSILVKIGVCKKNWKNDLPKLTIPVLILWASKDKTASIKWAHILHSLIRNSELYILQNYRHMAVMEKPDFFAEKIIKFII